MCSIDFYFISHQRMLESMRRTQVEAAGLTDDTRAYLDRHERGGIMAASTVAAALLRLLDEPDVNGEVLTVHPSAGPQGSRREGNDPTGRYAYLGAWSELRADDTAPLVDAMVAAVADRSANGWSGV
jgi:hypothetical protein